MDQQPVLIFIHIPKTAGATFSLILAHLYPQRVHSIYSFARIDDFQYIPEAERAKIDLLQGHFAYGIHQCLPRPAQYITFLRNPVERILSFYYYILRQPDNYLYEAVVHNNVSLAEFVNSSLSTELYNLQVRMIGGTKDWRKQSFPEKQEADLALAKKRLKEDFAAFGITERFDESLVLIRRALHWPITGRLLTYASVNIDPQRHARTEVTPQVIDDIQRNNALDMQLYEYACRLLDQRLRIASGAGFQAMILRWLGRLRNEQFWTLLAQDSSKHRNPEN